MNNGVALSNKALEALSSISGGIKKTTDRTNHIAVASNKQSTTVNAINSSVNNIAGTSNKFLAAMTQSAQAVEDLDGLSGSLKTLVVQFAI